MTTPSGQIGLSDVNVELGFPSTTSINMNQSNVRTLAGVGGSGTVISMNDLRGKSNRVAISLTISSNTTNYDVYSNRGPSYDPGKSDITVTINPGVSVYSTSTGSSAFAIPSSFNPADTVKIVNNGVIVGCGGSGGPGGGTGNPGTTGGSGGPALYVQFPSTIENNGTVGGGGGGGGGGSWRSESQGGDNPPLNYGGGGGGGGVAFGPGGSGGNTGGPLNGASGGPGSVSGGGGGGSGPAGAGNPPGGPGGGYGSAGSAGAAAAFGPRPGGASGAAVTGNPYITWNPTGTRSGPIS